MRLWVVEMRDHGRWKPITETAHTRSDGQFLLAWWRREKPREAFRLVCYDRRTR